MDQQDHDARSLALARAEEVLGPAAADWLQTPNAVLGCRPADLLEDAEGAERVLRVLGRIEDGVYS